MMPEALIVERSEERVSITFNRPEIRSPITIAVLEELHSILDAIHDEKLIFTGKGDVFASGADLREIAQVNGDSAKEYALRGQSLMKKISEKDSMAFINGYCFGGALDLAMACKKRIAAPRALFCHPGANLGIITGWGGTQRLPRLIGEGRALEMLFTGRRVGAEEALRIGLIDEIAAHIL